MKNLLFVLTILVTFSSRAGIMGVIKCNENVTPFTVYLIKGQDTLAKTVCKPSPDGFVFNFAEMKKGGGLSLFIRKDATFSKKIQFSLIKLSDAVMKGFDIFAPYKTGYLLDIYGNKTEMTSEAVTVKLHDVAAKLLYGSKKNLPLANIMVYLVNKAGDTLKSARTDEFGDFEFKQVNTQRTAIVVKNNDKIKNEKEIYLAKQNGIIISKFIKTAEGFEYKTLESDLVKLIDKEEQDAELKMNSFAKSADKSVTITENIYYPTGEFDVTDPAARKLNAIVTTLKANPTFKLEVLSHTDSKGDDASNKALSEKRSAAVIEYLVSKGIDKARLTGKGMGETKLANRCANDVNCSEKEHELNRRTEFKFIK